MTDEETYPRHLTAALDEALATARVVHIIGPRQAGKTTLVRDLYQDGEYITLDDAGVLAAMETDAGGQLASLTAGLGTAPLIIDEVQRSKGLAVAIKAIVDRKRRTGQFILTGSSNAFTTAEAVDSLAGRMRMLTLWPLTVAETEYVEANKFLDWAMQSAPKLEQISSSPKLQRADYIEILLKGGFPEPRERALRPRQRLYRDYVDLIIDRDVADILKIRKSDRLRRLVDQMAARTGEEVNVSGLSQLLGIDRATVDQYLDVLMRLSLIIKLGAWTSGESRREIKNAKYHFVDSGMVTALRRFGPQAFDANQATASALGGILESFVFGEIVRALPYQQAGEFRLYHWRSADRKEIDILAECDGKLIGCEVKASSQVRKSDFKQLRWFATDGPGRTRDFVGIVFYLGEHKLSFGENFFALPVSALWSVISREA